MEASMALEILNERWKQSRLIKVSGQAAMVLAWMIFLWHVTRPRPVTQEAEEAVAVVVVRALKRQPNARIVKVLTNPSCENNMTQAYP